MGPRCRRRWEEPSGHRPPAAVVPASGENGRRSHRYERQWVPWFHVKHQLPLLRFRLRSAAPRVARRSGRGRPPARPAAQAHPGRLHHPQQAQGAGAVAHLRPPGAAHRPARPGGGARQDPAGARRQRDPGDPRHQARPAGGQGLPVPARHAARPGRDRQGGGPRGPARLGAGERRAPGGLRRPVDTTSCTHDRQPEKASVATTTARASRCSRCTTSSPLHCRRSHLRRHRGLRPLLPSPHTA